MNAGRHPKAAAMSSPTRECPKPTGRVGSAAAGSARASPGGSHRRRRGEEGRDEASRGGRSHRPCRRGSDARARVSNFQVIVVDNHYLLVPYVLVQTHLQTSVASPPLSGPSYPYNVKIKILLCRGFRGIILQIEADEKDMRSSFLIS